MTGRLFLLALLVSFSTGTRCPAVEHADAIAVVLGAKATPPEKIAAGELARFLAKIYPKETFRVLADEPADAQYVLRIGTPESMPQLRQMLGKKQLAGPESFIVTRRSVGGKRVGLIVGADGPAVLYATYAILEKLGCGFYLSQDTLPEPCEEPFSLQAWDLADRPLTPTRLVFNWHNFLTGCSAWDLEDWQRWSTQSQKMGFNTIMVHAYGNNPMSGFRFRGQDKPVGWLSSSDLGRNWYVNHVNDVRRMHGGDAFSEEALRSTASVDGSYRQRTEAAQELMGQVFAHAQRRGMKVIFALDIDTLPGNPQELVMLLDESDRFEVRGHWLPNPDTSGGYAFYKAQVVGLMRAYPQIDTLALWHRTSGTPWMSLRYEEMPEPWRAEFDAACETDSEAQRGGHATRHFGMAKIVRASQKALREIGREDVTVAYGSWHFGFLAPADRFLPKDVPLIPLDYMVLVDRSQLKEADGREVIARIADHRPVLPVVWAHHDDGAHVMRPFTPYDNFHAKLADAGAARHGYGILHWMTRPMDLYFTSLSRQVWETTRDEPLDVTCRHTADRWFGPTRSDQLGEYLNRWITEAPMFARDTSDWFIDRPLSEPGPIAEAMHDRMKLLDPIDVSTRSDAARQRIAYLTGIERFSLDVHRIESLFRKAHALIAEDKNDEAKKVVAAIGRQPQQVVADLAKTVQLDGVNPGEQGLIVTLNTRWLTHYVRLRQRLAMEAIRYNFGPTLHDPFTERWGGKFTFYYAHDKAIWQTLGEKETGAKVYRARSNRPVVAQGLSSRDAAMLRSGIVIEEPWTFSMTPIMSRPHGRGDVKTTQALSAGE